MIEKACFRFILSAMMDKLEAARWAWRGWQPNIP